MEICYYHNILTRNFFWEVENGNFCDYFQSSSINVSYLIPFFRRCQSAMGPKILWNCIKMFLLIKKFTIHFLEIVLGCSEKYFLQSKAILDFRETFKRILPQDAINKIYDLFSPLLSCPIIYVFLNFVTFQIIRSQSSYFKKIWHYFCE